MSTTDPTNDSPAAVSGVPAEATNLGEIRARQNERRRNRPERDPLRQAIVDIDFLIAKVDELSSTLTDPALREGIAAEVLGPVRALVTEFERRAATGSPMLSTTDTITDLRAALSDPVQAAEPCEHSWGMDNEYREACLRCGHCPEDAARRPVQAAEDES